MSDKFWLFNFGGDVFVFLRSYISHVMFYKTIVVDQYANENILRFK